MTRLPAAWVAQLRAQADLPPARPRVPLRCAGAVIGSVEPDLFPRARVSALLARPLADGWELAGEDPTATLHELALALRTAGLAHAWRDEQLAVRDTSGGVIATVERAVVRLLGIATHAVHLLGLAPDGRHWVQRRSLTKANDPGLWDTLMGGMVPACDTVTEALARETWEEAGLRVDALHAMEHGGAFTMRRPSGNGTGGYVVETIAWYRCVVPEGQVPRNQDGEVDEFACLAEDDLTAMLLREEFTLEAALVFAEHGLAARP